ncbi:CPBP family glutamic-type intramembrane protease [Coleofasciculus sp. FACHB-1120]|uniref:CPBP family glutamic-type intramembrane protease n=1 Tax=Coleofasciculus sp. FACHB-1120 TaxID=2692783 RepID=UPI001683D9A2|nr:CPBP family glutamic-type intramembrane protease [Coleofasciculus sp. FACHB-1120]MBD2741200.1 CPBP family intramembrane metalloprotease [Coleofasciculus sp. FACHB-1120]
MVDAYISNVPAIAATFELSINAIALSQNLGIVHRLIASTSTLPNAQAWLYSAALVLIYALISLPIGFNLGFLKLDIETSWEIIVGVIARCFFSPAISEELFFRILLLPHPTENATPATLWLWGGISLAMFIIYHPLNAVTFYPDGLQTFFNPVFLFLAALLGVICTLAYFQSGSLWLPVAIHWLIVVVWLLLFGGYKRMSEKS